MPEDQPIADISLVDTVRAASSHPRGACPDTRPATTAPASPPLAQSDENKLVWMKCLPMPIKRVASRLLDLGRLTWDDLLEVRPACASGAPAPSAPSATLGALCTLRTLGHPRAPLAPSAPSTPSAPRAPPSAPAAPSAPRAPPLAQDGIFFWEIGFTERPEWIERDRWHQTVCNFLLVRAPPHPAHCTAQSRRRPPRPLCP